jgi:exodeoxyribonuclease VII small subunit
MANKKFSYNQAVNELEVILSEIENDDLDIDVLSDKVRKATQLIKECKLRLKKTSAEIDSILEDWDANEDI